MLRLCCLTLSAAVIACGPETLCGNGAIDSRQLCLANPIEFGETLEGGAIAALDYNGGGLTDLLWNGGGDEGDIRYLPDADVHAAVGLVDVRSREFTKVGRLGADPLDDIVSFSLGNSGIHVIWGQTDGHVETGLLLDDGLASKDVAIGDVNGDGAGDLVALEWEVRIWLASEDGEFLAPVASSFPCDALALDVEVIPADTGPGTVAVGCTEGGSIAVARGTPDGSLSAWTTTQVDDKIGPIRPLPPLDGQARLAALGMWGDFSVYTGTVASDGTLDLTRHSLGGDSVPLDVGDMDADGLVDIVMLPKRADDTGRLGPNITVRFGPTFKKQSRIRLDFDPINVAVGNFDGDDLPDLVVTSKEKNGLVFFHGRL